MTESQPRDPRTGRFIKQEAAEILTQLRVSSTVDLENEDDPLETLKEKLNEADKAFDYYEMQHDLIQQKNDILELQLKVAKAEQSEARQKREQKEKELAKQYQAISLLKEATIGTENMNVKFPPPEEFDGTPGKLPYFLTQCELVFSRKTEQFESHNSRTLYALAHMTKGRALEFKQQVLTNQALFLKDIAKLAEENNLTPWEATKKRFRDVFVSVTSTLEAQEKMLHAHQGNRSVEEYSIEFAMWNGEAELDDKAALLLWKKGLKPAIKQRIYESGDIPVGFDKWVKRASAIDLGWREYQLQNRGNSQGRLRKTNETKTGQRPRLSDEDYQKRRKEGLCYKCGNKGHLAKDCYAKNRRTQTSEESPITNEEDFH